jgi:FtsZ-interacting cell division protein ZipA
MNTSTIVIVIVVVVVIGIILGLIFSRRKKTEQLQNKFGTEYDHTVERLGDDKKAQKELEDRQKHVESFKIRPLTEVEHERYLNDCAAVQSKFVDEPGQAIIDANHLIIEVMQLRNYPISDFDQRAADISVKYPSLVTNYRAAREIAIRNMENKADTEELRNAMIHYRSLFDELLKSDTTIKEEEKLR